MLAPPFPQDEAKRLNALKCLNILDTPADPSYDAITKLAQALFDVPIVAISLVDTNRQWFKSIQGIDVCETSREVSFCGHTILQDNIFVVPNALEDERFADNPLVTQAPHIRFYAGVPLRDPGGYRIGTLCIIDSAPRHFSSKRLSLLKHFATIIENEMLVRRSVNGYLQQISGIQNQYISGEPVENIYQDALDFLLLYNGSQAAMLAYIDQGNGKCCFVQRTSGVFSDKARAKCKERLKRSIESGECIKARKTTLCDSSLTVPILGHGGTIGAYTIVGGGIEKNPNLLKHLSHLTNTLAGVIESSHYAEVITDLAKKDSLTRVLNRRAFEEELQRAVEQSESFCLLMLDLDDFKKVNDVYGHQLGDQLLLNFVKRISAQLKPNDIVGRLGGDEFGVILKDVSSPSVVGKVVDRIIHKSATHYRLGEQKLMCTSSVGAAFYPVAGKTVDKLLKHADMALYESKKHKSKWCFYTKEMREVYQQEIMLEKQIEMTLDGKSFYYEYQPQVQMSTGEVMGFEILIRAKNNGLKGMSPAVFLPLIERMGLVGEINQLAVDHVIEDIGLQISKAARPMRVAINISPQVLDFYDHLNGLVKQLEKSCLDFSKINLELEITESSFIQNDVFSRQNLKKLFSKISEKGITLGMDDFGSEYSSLRRIVEYPFNTIKIDQLFVQKLGTKNSESAKAVIKAVVNLAKDLGLCVVAEGVETQRQAKLLQKLGCDCAQGFYFFKPLSRRKLASLLAQKRV